MSLHTAAKYLQTHGRGPDDKLVHMSSNEVRGLQALAKAHGGSLSINPKTGLPEAGFLDAILPTVIGVGLTAASGGALSPMMAGLMVGGGYGLITGDLSKGLMAGLGAYGGAGLGEGLMAAGSTATPLTAAGSTPATTAGGIPMTTGVDAGTQALGAASGNAPVATTQVPYGPAATGQVAPTASQAATGTGGTQGATGSTWDRLKTMGQGVTNLMDSSDARKAAYKALPTGTLPALGLSAVNVAQQVNQPDFKEQGVYDGPLSKYRLSANFQPYTAPTPNPYYRPTGLGYAAGGDIMMAAGGSYDDEPRGDDQGYGFAEGGIARYASQGQVAYLPRTAGIPDVGIYHDTDIDTAKKSALEAALIRNKKAASAANIKLAAMPKTSIKGLGDIPEAASGGSIGGYSDGGRMLKGPGDGMSDSIPATIGKRQPARLADGEFVVPADVVSHLGNGSTDAGAKRLYGMMDKVRQARTGKKKQAPAVKAEKYLPV